MNKSVKSLELDKILAAVAMCAGSEKGKQMILESEPTGDLSAVSALQSETTEAFYAMNSCNCYPSFEVDEITESLVRAKKMSVLTMGELLKVARLLRLTRNLKNSIAKLDPSRAPIVTKMANQLFLVLPVYYLILPRISQDQLLRMRYLHHNNQAGTQDHRLL